MFKVREMLDRILGNLGSLVRLFAILALCTAGCTQTGTPFARHPRHRSPIDPNVPEPIRSAIEPRHGTPYDYYRPSRYDRSLSWPLVIVCHGSGFDSPSRRIRAWDRLAEQHGFLVAALALERIGRGEPAERLARLRTNEERILSTVRHIRAGHSTSADRIFIHGYAAGAASALHTGLRSPELFRAVAVTLPKLDESLLSHVPEVLDPLQPVFVQYRFSEALTGKGGRQCCQWLRDRGANLIELAQGRSGPLEPKAVVGFFQDVVRNVPFLHVSAEPAGEENPLAVRLRLDASFTPVRYQWSFGDGESSSAAEPIHDYASPGEYQVQATVVSPDGREFTRAVRLRIPELTVRCTKPNDALP